MDEYIKPSLDPEKPKLDGLFSDSPETPEGKYLVLRRDGTVPPWPSFVLGAGDKAADWTLWFYSWMAWWFGMAKGYRQAVARRAKKFTDWRKQNGEGDPDAGRHRIDDPWVISKMREGQSS